MRSALVSFVFLATTLAAPFIDHPDHASLAGMSPEDLAVYERQIRIVGAQPLPPNVNPALNVHRLVADSAHPFVAPGMTDKRGPCPASNTMANHGYLPRNGIATPAQIVNASMEVFGMGYNLAVFTTYAQHLVGGNQLTDLLSLGTYDIRTGIYDPELAGGYSKHGTFEGDASLSRSDAYLGDNASPNITLINEMVGIMNQYGGGFYNASAAAHTRAKVFNYGIAHNPTFKYDFPRYLTSYGEGGFPLGMMSNLSEPTYAQGPSESIMRSFFVDQKFPNKFHRRNGSWEFDKVGDLFITQLNIIPTVPGTNNGVAPGTFAADPRFPNIQFICEAYKQFLVVVFKLYPAPTGLLKTALRGNLANFYVSIVNVDPTCAKVADPWAA